MTIKAQTDANALRCPRCGQVVDFRKDEVTIYPHRDELVGAPCPMGGVDIDRAHRLVAEHRRLIEEMRG